jgi:hemolysin activation/secretion protein
MVNPAALTLALALLSISLFLPAGSARAQIPPAASVVPQGSPIPRILPLSPPAVRPDVIAPLPSARSGEMPNQAVGVTSVAVDGVTAYPLEAIMRFTAGLIGPAVPLAQIDAARLAILGHYRADGFVLTAVSAILDAAGHLRFVVTEGRIASVKLDGDIGPAGTQVLRFLNRLTEAPVIDNATLERYLLLAQDVPGVTLHAVLEPSTGQPGALNLIAQVERSPVAGLATVDNRAFNQTGPIEFLGVADVNSFTQYGEKTEISYYHTFPNSQNFAQASTEAFVGSSGLKLRAYGGAGSVVPSGSLAITGYDAMTTVFGLVASYPVIRSRQQTLNVYTSFDGLDSNVSTNLTGVEAQQSYDAVRAFRLGEEFALSDVMLGADRSAVNVLHARFSQGVPILGAATNGGAPTAARLNEQGDFGKIDFEASRTQTLFVPWSSANVAILALLTGQWSANILPPSEQFYLGGARFTRGYYAGQVPGDKALAATTELQLNTDTKMSLFGKAVDITSQWYLFYDWGETWQNQATDFAAKVGSAGGGVRSQLTHNVEVDLEILARFNRYPTGSGNAISPLHGSAFYWRVLTRF